jgi:hypothetical protein
MRTAATAMSRTAAAAMSRTTATAAPLHIAAAPTLDEGAVRTYVAASMAAAAAARIRVAAASTTLTEELFYDAATATAGWFLECVVAGHFRELFANMEIAAVDPRDHTGHTHAVVCRPLGPHFMTLAPVNILTRDFVWVCPFRISIGNGAAVMIMTRTMVAGAGGARPDSPPQLIDIITPDTVGPSTGVPFQLRATPESNYDFICGHVHGEGAVFACTAAQNQAVLSAFNVKKLDGIVVAIYQGNFMCAPFKRGPSRRGAVAMRCCTRTTTPLGVIGIEVWSIPVNMS